MDAPTFSLTWYNLAFQENIFLCDEDLVGGEERRTLPPTS
jgi:hypothetical protein